MSMNYSRAVFLINNDVRGIVCTYEADEPNKPAAPRTTFKSLDPDLKVGDFVIVPTNTRHGMTVCKVVETDVDVDIEVGTHTDWIIGKIDRRPYEQTLADETDAIQKIKSAELRRKREQLRDSMFKDHVATLSELRIANMGDTSLPAPPPMTPPSVDGVKI